jgi:DNA-binding HxlR family transcriptional regulator
VGKRWTGAIIYAVFNGKTRFVDIAATVPGLSDRLLTERLRELTEAGILERHAAESAPSRPVYRLTRKGLDLRDVLIALHRWAERWDADQEGVLSRGPPLGQRPCAFGAPPTTGIP